MRLNVLYIRPYLLLCASVFHFHTLDKQITQSTAMAEKVTKMVLKVDLQCPSCYKKIKKTLYQFPQIRDQAYDEKANTVTIIVVCCNPERIKRKLCGKGGKTVKSIDIIVPPPPPKPAPPNPTPPKTDAKPPGADKPKQAAPAPAQAPAPKPKSDPTKPEPAKTVEQNPVQGYPPVYPIIGVYCRPRYEGYDGGPSYLVHGSPLPCHDGWGERRSPPTPPPRYEVPSREPPLCYDGCGCGYGGTRGYNHCDQYICEENPSACTVM